MVRLESDMSEPVSYWLRDYGFTPYAEFPNYTSPVDIVGINGEGYTIAIELKKSLTKHVVRKAILNQTRFNESWCVVATSPRDLSRCEKFGIGVMSYQGVLYPLLDARYGEVIPYYVSRNIAAIKGIQEGGIGGVPNQKGIGPAQDVYRRMQEYLANNPKATWRERFENIRNHYVSQSSFYSAMRMLEERRRIAKRRALRKGGN